MGRAAEFMLIVDDRTELTADDPPIDDEELRLTGPLLDV